MKIAVHLRAAVFDWSESPISLNKQFLKKAKAEIQIIFKSLLARDGISGWMWKRRNKYNRNTAQRLLHQGRDLVIQMLPSNYQSIMRQLVSNFPSSYGYLVLMKQLTSRSIRNSVPNLYVFLLRSFPRVNVRINQVHGSVLHHLSTNF